MFNTSVKLAIYSVLCDSLIISFRLSEVLKRFFSVNPYSEVFALWHFDGKRRILPSL